MSENKEDKTTDNKTEKKTKNITLDATSINEQLGGLMQGVRMMLSAFPWWLQEAILSEMLSEVQSKHHGMAMCQSVAQSPEFKEFKAQIEEEFVDDDDDVHEDEDWHSKTDDTKLKFNGKAFDQLFGKDASLVRGMLMDYQKSMNGGKKVVHPEVKEEEYRSGLVDDTVECYMCGSIQLAGLKVCSVCGAVLDDEASDTVEEEDLHSNTDSPRDEKQ